MISRSGPAPILVEDCWRLILDSTSTNRQRPMSLRTRVILKAIMHAKTVLSDSDIRHALDQVAVEEDIRIPHEQLQLVTQAIREQRAATCTMKPSPMMQLSKDRLVRMKVSQLKEILLGHGIQPAGLKADMIEQILAARDKALSTARRKEQGGISSPREDEPASTILILDYRLEMFPWEAIDVLQEANVTRMPSLELLLRNAEACCDKSQHGVTLGQTAVIDNTRVSFALNPGGDLIATQQNLESRFRQGRDELNWSGVIGYAPDEAMTRKFLTESDLFIYCGHGSGERYFPRDKIAALGAKACSAALLFGCSSGRMEREGVFGPNGAVLAYLRARSPCVLAMLWDVTDRDVDLMCIDLFDKWLMETGRDASKTELSHALKSARKCCKLQFLNGFAAVCYGIPLVVRDDTQKPAKRQRL
ncbi:hypothetical protein PINS_up008699 [Pythium insidiosum]|nr:hypothetical protein PINS_up008699 [Pythium insidiosum]